MAWRVQATWTVGGDERSYEPVFTRTKWGARRAARDMSRTLAHFPTLVVLVERVRTAGDGSGRSAASSPERSA